MEPVETDIQDNNAKSGEKAHRALIYALALSVIGLALSAELLRVHLTVAGDPGHAFACRVNEAVDCGAVAQSSQALFLGLPVPIWCIAAYAAVFLLAAAGLFWKRIPPRLAGDYVFPIALWSVGYSAYLAFVSAFVIKTFCAYCAGLYAANLGLFFACLGACSPVVEWPRRRWLDWKWLARDPVLVAGVVFLGILALGGTAYLWAWSHRPQSVELAPGVSIQVEGDPVYGPEKAPITIIEFSDYQCPACRRMHPTLREIVDNYKGKVRLIHKNYPLDANCNQSMNSHMHPQACDAAYASECALTMIDDYETYSELLWRADDLSKPALIELAVKMGADSKAFNECMLSNETKLKVFEDVKAGDLIEINSTPTFVINGYKFVGVQHYKVCSGMIRRLLRGEKPPPDSGVKLEF